MASETVTYKLVLDANGFIVSLKKAEKGMADLGKGAKKGADEASRAMDRLHKQALQMNRAFDSSGAKAKRFTGDVGILTASLENAAKATGLNIKNLNEIDTVANTASLGFKGLTTSMVGLNTATFGVVAGGLALGTMIGNWLKDIPAVAKAADNLANVWHRLSTSQEEMDRQALGRMSAEDWRKSQQGRSAAAGKVALDMKEATRWRGVVDQAMGGGKSADQILDLYGDRMPDAIKKWLEASKEAATQHKKATDEAKRGMTELLDFQNKVTDGAESAIKLMFDQQGKSFTEANATGDRGIPETLLVAHKQRNLDLINKMNAGIGSAGQMGAGAGLQTATKAGVDFSNMMGQVAHAFTLLGVGPNSILGKTIGTLTVAAGSLDALGKRDKGATGLSGLLGKALPVLGIASAGFSLIKGLFGGGPSKEEKAAAAAQKEADRKRIMDAARASRSSSIDALGGASAAFFGSRSILNEDDAKRQGTLFAAAWGQVVKEKGVLAAVDAFGETFEKMSADMAARGIAPGAAFGAIGAQMALGKNEAFRSAAGNAQNAAGFLGALGGSGGLSQDAFRAFEQEARASFAAGKDAAAGAGMGADEATKAGFAANGSLLKALLNESMTSGVALSADVQAMVDQAGVTADVNIQQLDELRQIRAAVQGMNGMPAAGGPFGGDEGASIGHMPQDTFPGFAGGGEITRSGLAYVHSGEMIGDREQMAQMGGNTTNQITVMASGNKDTDALLVDKLAKLFRSGKATRLEAAMHDRGIRPQGRTK